MSVLSNAELWIQNPQQGTVRRLIDTENYSDLFPGIPVLGERVPIAWNSWNTNELQTGFNLLSWAHIGSNPYTGDKIYEFPLSQKGYAPQEFDLRIRAMKWYNGGTTDFPIGSGMADVSTHFPPQVRYWFEFGPVSPDLFCSRTALFRGTVRTAVYPGPAFGSNGMLQSYLESMFGDFNADFICEGLWIDNYLSYTQTSIDPPFVRYLDGFSDSTSVLVRRKADEAINIAAYPVSYTGWAMGVSMPCVKGDIDSWSPQQGVFSPSFIGEVFRLTNPISGT